jgi:hypothetical protein
MGAFYNGAKMRLEGVVPASAGVVVVLRGVEKDEFFNKKGRVGPIWLNRDRVHVTQAPSLFLSYSSDDLNSLLDRAAIDEYQLDEAAIQKRMGSRVHCKCSVSTTAHAGAAPPPCKGVEPDAQYSELIRTSYLSLKIADGSYQKFAHAVRLAEAGDGTTSYRLELRWPRKAPPGSYRVEVYACRNRAVVARNTASLNVVEVGFPARMASLAGEKPWAYGLLAVVAAVLAGFSIDSLAARLRGRRQRPGPPPARGLPHEGEPAEALHASADVAEDEHVHHV